MTTTQARNITLEGSAAMVVEFFGKLSLSTWLSKYTNLICYICGLNESRVEYSIHR
jgi:hypothetical protein